MADMDTFSIHGGLSRLPSSTELARIQHTIDSLKASEDLLRERLNETGKIPESEELYRDNRHHAVEIGAGWEQLGRMIGELPDSFIDKVFLAGETQNGLRRSSLLIEMTWNQFTTQR